MENVIIMIVAIVAGVATYIIANILNKGPVFASALVTLVSGIVFPYFLPSIGNSLAVVAACSSYAGMVSIKNAPKLWDMSMISLITGVLFIILSNAYVGIGGRLGTIAAISCFAWIGFKRVFVRERSPKKEKYIYETVDVK